MDIGCAIGKWLPVLSPAFKKVVAVDISAKNLEIAQQLYPQYKNVQYVRADMSGKKTKVPRCDFAICINAILTPHVKTVNFFQSLSACVKKGGYIVLTILPRIVDADQHDSAGVSNRSTIISSNKKCKRSPSQME
jgi:2-polyprenyl-3-methyl-5-hydroxy-6-metoxy-1,4-benzoquinol methylase